MTGRKFLSPPSWRSLRNPITGAPRARKLKLFSNMARRNPFSSYAGSPYKKRACGKLAQGLMTGRKVLSPPLSWLAPQSDHGSAACAETEAFFQYGPPQSFFELSWLALQKARQGANFKKPPPLMARSAVRSRECSVRGALQKARAREVGARVMAGRKFLSPPLLALAPQSDHGSAARAETEAFVQYGPPQSFFELTWLALQKKSTRAGSCATTDDKAQISQVLALMARSAIRSRERRARGN